MTDDFRRLVVRACPYLRVLGSLAKNPLLPTRPAVIIRNLAGQIYVFSSVQYPPPERPLFALLLHLQRTQTSSRRSLLPSSLKTRP